MPLQNKYIYVILNYINYVIIYIKILKEKGKLLYMAEEIGKSLISLKKAGKIYGSVTALRKIDLDIVVIIDEKIKENGPIYSYVRQRLDRAVYMDYTKGNIYVLNLNNLNKFKNLFKIK